MARKISVPHYQNLGGLNTRVSVASVTNEEAIIADNCYFPEPGAIDQFPGFADILATPSADEIRLIFQHVDRLTQAKTKLVVTGQRLEKQSGDLFTEQLWDSFVDSDKLCTAAQLFDDTIICTGEDAPLIFNNQGVDFIDTDFRPQICIRFNNYMIFLKDKTNPYRIAFSSLGDAKILNENLNFEEITDIGPLTGAFVLHNSLYVTSLTGLKKIDGSDLQATSPTYDFRSISVLIDEGSVNHHSIVVAHNRAYWLGMYGYYEYGGGLEAEPISWNIRPVFRDGVNRLHLDKAVAYHDQEKNLVVISVPSAFSTTNDEHYCFHYEKEIRGWTVLKGFEVSYWAQIEETGNFPITWHGRAGGQIGRHGNQPDYGSVAVAFCYQSGWMAGKEPQLRKIMKHIIPIIKGTGLDTFDVTLFTDFDIQENTGFPKTITIPALGPLWGTPDWGAFEWGGPLAELVEAIGVPASIARTWSVKFAHESLGKRFKVTGWNTIIIPKGLTK